MQSNLLHGAVMKKLPCAWIYCVLWALAKQFVYSESDVPLIIEESDMPQTDV